MNKKTLGIAIPYWKNTIQCEEQFKKLMEKINQQLTDDMIVYIYEDGQYSEWLSEYDNTSDNDICVVFNLYNHGVSYARNQCLFFLTEFVDVDYILFLDSDDTIDDDYLQTMCEYCKKNEYEIYESGFYVKDVLTQFSPTLVRCGVVGSAIKTDIIGDTKFDEHLQIGEDTKFMKEVCDLSKYKKCFVPTYYHYQLGINEYSLTMNYANKIISKERG